MNCRNCGHGAGFRGNKHVRNGRYTCKRTSDYESSSFAADDLVVDSGYSSYSSYADSPGSSSSSDSGGYGGDSSSSCGSSGD